MLDVKNIPKKYDIILLTLPPWEPETPPVGLGYLTEYLTKKGLSVKVFDLNIEIYDKLKDKYDYLQSK